MQRISKTGISGWAILLLAALWLSGCTASMKAKSSFEQAEQLVAEEKFDQAIEKYNEAIELDPGSKAYKLKLLSARTRAAADHAKWARLLAKEGKYEQALNEYALAKRYSSGIEYIEREIGDLQKMVESERFAEEGANFYAAGDLAAAGKAIDKALQLNPNNAKAVAIKDLLGRDRKTTVMDGIELDMASSEPITLSLKKVKLKEVFSILTRLSGINFIFDEKVRDDSIEVFLEKTTFAQAMELLLQMNGLEKKVLNSRTIIIYPSTRDKEKQYDDQVIQTFYLSNIEAKKAVNLLRTMLQLRKVYVHEERNALVVRDKPEVVKLAEQILEAADREDSEVVLALELVSVSDSDTLDIGTTLSTYSVGVGLSKDGQNIVSSGLPTDGTVGNMITSLNGLQSYFTLPSAVFDFAKTLKSTNILANPKIRVRNKEKAKVHVGTREPVITAISNDTTVSSNVQYVDVGIKLDVQPIIQLDNTVETKLKLEVSQVISRETVGTPVAPVTALTISTTNAETVLTLRDGEQTIIGGLFEQMDSKQKNTIPVLGDIPGLGALFSGFSNQDDKREILLSITPYIVKRLNVPGADVATIWSGGEDNLKIGPNFGAFSRPLESEVESTTLQAAPRVKSLQVDESDGSAATEEVPALQPPGKGEAGTAAASAAGKSKGPEPAGKPVADQAAGGGADLQKAAPEAAAGGAAPDAEAVPTEVLKPAGPVATPKPADLYFVAPAEVAVGQDFSVAVETRGVDKLFSAAMFVKFDPAVLKVSGVFEGPFFKKDDPSATFTSSPDNSAGQVVVGGKQVDGGQGVSGSGIMCIVNFKAMAAGESALEFNRINFRNTVGDQLEVLPRAAKITVR